MRTLCCALVLLTLGLVNAEKSDEGGMGSGYMLAFPMDESGMVAAESAPQVAQVVLPESVVKEVEKEVEKEIRESSSVPTVVELSSQEKKGDEVMTTTAAPSTSKPTTTTTKAPYKAPSESDRRRKIEEMRKILGLPPSGQKPKFVPPEKPKSILPALLLKAALPRLQESRLSDILPLPLSLMRRSDPGPSRGAGPRIAALSNIFQAASAFMRRAMIEDESNVQNVRNSKRNQKSKNGAKEQMMMLDAEKLSKLLGDDRDDDDEDDEDDDLPFIPFPRPFQGPFRLPFGAARQQGPPMPFGLPRQSNMGPMGARRMPPMIQSRSFPRIPMHPSQYPPRPVPFHQPMMIPQQMPHFQPQQQMHVPMHVPMQAHHAPMYAPYPPQQPQQMLLILPQRAMASHQMPQHVQFVPQPYPMPMPHPMHYDHMQAASHPAPSPMQQVLLMLHPVPAPQPQMPQIHRQPMVQYRQASPLEYRNAPDYEDESDEREPGDDRGEPQDGARYVMVLDNSVGPSPRGMPQFSQARASQHQPQPQMISPLRKMQIIREIIMARQSLVPRPRQGNSIFPFHPPVPRLVPKMMAELRQKTGERLAAASFLRPIFLPAGL